MKKKIFAIIGIVLASVLVFAGAVFGIMALMGKFDEPEVYPVRLQFENNEQTIVYDSANPDFRYSFVLNGYSDSEYEVNRKNCYIYFEDGSNLITLYNADGVRLEANDHNRYLVECNEPIYYTVNEVTEADFADENYGRVVLNARDEKDHVQSSNLLTIWIDREVKDVMLDYSNAIFNSTNDSQELTIGTNVNLDFIFTSDPIRSLDPISRETDGKIVELYFVGTQNNPEKDGYVLIDRDNINNEEVFSKYNYPIRYNEATNTYSFMSDIDGTYLFRIAVFPTFQAREDYLNSEYAGTDSNSERVNKMVNTLLTIRVVNSDISNVQMQPTSSAGVGLNLYSDNNYITLSGTTDIEGANNNNLDLRMYKDSETTTIRFNEVDFDITQSTNWQSNNIEFTSTSDTEYPKTINLDFSGNTASVRLTNFGTLDGEYNNISIAREDEDTCILTIAGIADSFTINLSTSSAPQINLDDRQLIHSISYANETLISSNGAAFIDYDGVTYGMQVLMSGSYLEFYTLSGSTLTKVSADQFAYEVSDPFGTAEQKSWNVIAKSMPNILETEDLVLGILVVNNSGGSIGNGIFFSSVNVRVNIQNLDTDYTNNDGSRTYNLGVTYDDENNYTAVYPELDFDDIITINSGTYDACVFITPEQTVDEYRIDVIEGLVFVDANGNRYVLVGYFEDDHFVNQVRVRDMGANNVERTDKSPDTNIYLLQLRNGYQQTAGDYIDMIVANNQLDLGYLTSGSDGISRYEKLLGNLNNPEDVNIIADVVSSYLNSTEAITISINYQLVDEIEYTFDTDAYLTIYNNRIEVVEGTSDHHLTISSDITNMLRDIYNVGGFSLDSVRVYMYNAQGTRVEADNITINDITLTDDGDIRLSFNTNSATTDRYFKIALSYNSVEIVSDLPIYVMSTSATDVDFVIVGQDGEVSSVDLQSSSAEALNADIYFKVIIGYDTDSREYTYRYQFINGDNVVDISSDVFNSQSAQLENEETGFKVLPAYMDIYKNIDYSTIDSSIAHFTETNVEGVDTYDLLITESGTTVIEISTDAIRRYVKLVVEPETVDGVNSFTFEKTSSVLGDNGIYTIRTSNQSINLNTYFTYSYGNTQISTNSSFIRLDSSSIDYTYFGGNKELTLVTEENGDFKFVTTDENEDVLTIASGANTWTITRNSYRYSALTIVLTLNTATNGSVELTIEFTSDTEINFNDEWTDYSYYQGTTALLYSVNDEVNDPIFIVNTTNTGNTITATLDSKPADSNAEISQDSTRYLITFDKVGNYTFSFSSNGSNIASFTLRVLPNVVGEFADSDINELISDETGRNISELITLKSYNTQGVVYGIDGLYTSDRLIDADSDKYQNVDFTSNAESSLLTKANPTDATYNIGWITNLGESIVENITFTYTEDDMTINLISRDVTISNKYELIFDTTATDENGNQYYQDGVFTIMAQKVYNNFAHLNSAGSSLIINSFSMIWENGDSQIYFENSGVDQFSLKRFINQDYNEAEILFTFNVVGKGDLKYNTATNEDYTFRLMPYLPNETLMVLAYSERSFDLMLGVFDIFSLNNGYITSMLVSGVSDETFFDTVPEGSGYVSGNSDHRAMTTIQSLSGRNSVDVTVTYTISYSDGSTYDYEKVITIYNNQEILISYPFVDSVQQTGATTNNFVLLDTDSSAVDTRELDASNLNANFENTTSSGEQVYSIAINSEAYYEPVRMGQTIDFDYDSIYGLTRAELTRRTYGSDELDYTISLVGYQDRPNVRSYLSNIVIDNSEKTITFATDNSYGFTYGYYIFKLLSNGSGCVSYYFVYLYNQNNSPYSNVDANSQYKYDYVFTADDNIEILDGNELLGEALNSDIFSTYFNISSSINVATDIDFYLIGLDEMNEGEAKAQNSTDSTVVDLQDLLYHNIENYILQPCTNYTTLKIGLVYYVGTAQIFIGSIYVYIAPIYQEQIRLDSGLTPYSEYIDGNSIYNGEYKVDIQKSASTNEYENPFSGINTRADSSSVSGGTWSARIIGDTTGVIGLANNSTTLELQNYVLDEDLDFIVEYTYSFNNVDFVLYVHYTYKAVSLSVRKSISVGQFNSGDGSFNNTYGLKDLIGTTSTYEGEVTIATSGTGNSMTINLADNSLTGSNPISFGIGSLSFSNGNLVFSQTTQSYTSQFTITFNDLASSLGEVSYNVTVTVGSGLYYTFEGEGANANNRDLSEITAGDLYNQEIGSSISLVKSQTTANSTHYSIGGLDIYTNVDSELEFTFSEPEYTVGGDQSFTASDSIDFVHSASAHKITMTIRVKSGNNYFTANDNASSFTYYATIVQTYQNIVANYYVAGADHENVRSNETISDLHSNLFGSITANVTDVADTSDMNIINARRIALQIGVDNIITNFNYEAMGFDDQNNPNYIYMQGSNVSLSSSAGVYNVTFNPVEVNTPVYIDLNNKTGATTRYTYQVMSSTEYTDGLEINERNTGLINSDSTQYISFVINDPSQNISLNYTNEDIATLMDGRNSVFYITGFTAYLNANTTALSSGNIQVSKSLDEENATTTYTFNIDIDPTTDVNNGTFTITLGAGRVFDISLSRGTNTSLFESLRLRMTMYGDSGNLITYGDADSTRSLEIVFFNYNISSTTSTTRDSIYATNSIYLDEEINIYSNTDTAEDKTNHLDTAALITGDMSTENVSTYYIGNNSAQAISSDDNNIFTYFLTTSTGKNVIQTKAVGETATVDLRFKIEISLAGNNYSLGIVEYNFYLQPNYKFVINNEAVTNIDNEVTTNYILTNKITDTYSNDLDYYEDLTDTYDSNGTNISNVFYHFDLNLQLRTADDDIQITDNNFRIEIEGSQWGSDYVEILNNNTIHFKRDFTGELVLSVKVDRGVNGVYEMIWIINVRGYINLSYKTGTNGQNAIYSNNSPGGYASYSTVNTVGISSALDSTGILSSNTFTALNGVSLLPAGQIEITVDYAINEYSNTIDVTSITNFASMSTEEMENLDDYENTLTLQLPSVEQSAGPNYTSFNVTYRIKYKYLDQETDYMYVTYRVHNPENVTLNDQNSSIDVDKLSDNVMPLFYFEEVYDTTHQTNSGKQTFTIRLTYSNDVGYRKVLRVGEDTTDYVYNENTTYYESSSDSNTYYIIDENANAIYYYTSDAVADTYTIDSHTVNTNIPDDETSPESTKKALFNSGYDNIHAYAEFITNIDSVRLSDMTGYAGDVSEIYFRLTYIDDIGAYAINLEDAYTNSSLTTGHSGVLFENELISDLDVMADGGSAVHVEGHNGTSGFRLTTENAITPKSSVRLSEMFYQGQFSVPSYYNNTSIIGVADTLSQTTSEGWVSSGSASVGASSLCTISVQTSATDTMDYYLYEITYTDDSTTNSLYSLTATFYALQSPTTANRIIVMNYRAYGERFFFNIPYNYTDSTLNMNEAVLVYKNNGAGSLERDYLTGSTVELADPSSAIASYITYNNASITATKSNLQSYKNSHPTATTLSEYFTVTNDSITLYFLVSFALPASPFVEATYSVDAGNYAIRLMQPEDTSTNFLYIYNSSNALVPLTADNVEDTSVLENGSSYLLSYQNGDITLDSALVDTYFSENPTALRLVIDFTMTITHDVTNSSTLNFQIVINK